MTTDAGVQWFIGLGFRPAVWTASHRADEVDPVRLAPALDADIPFLAKYDALEPFLPSEGYVWGTWIPAPVTDAPQITAASLAGHIPGPQPVAPWHPVTPSQPWWPSEPEPWFPCCIVQEPEPPLPPIAPVPVPAASVCLIIALAGLAMLRRKA